MTEFGGGGDLGGGDLGSGDLGGRYGGDFGGGSYGGDVGGGALAGVTAPTFGPDPSAPSFTADPLGTPTFGSVAADPFGATSTSVLDPAPATPLMFTPPPATPLEPAAPTPDLGGLGLTAPTFAADPSVPSSTTTTAGDGFSITPAAATAVVDTATGLSTDTGAAGQGLASLALTPSAFGTFGEPVATAQTALQTGWGDAFTSLTNGLTTLFGNVGTAIGNYLSADSDVAAGFGGATATPPAPTVPPQDKPLPPGAWDSMQLSDLYTPFLLDGAAANFAAHGWWNAAGLVDHYLGGTGTDYTVDPGQMLTDIPTFRSQVDAAVAEHAGQTTWQTDWQNTNTDLRDANGAYVGQQSSDWYWGLHDFRYRVYGTTDPTTGQGNYTVEVYKPYVFGSPRSDITIPSSIPFLGGTKIPQDDLQHLHDTGRAADFIVRGSATFPR